MPGPAEPVSILRLSPHHWLEEGTYDDFKENILNSPAGQCPINPGGSSMWRSLQRVPDPCAEVAAADVCTLITFYGSNSVSRQVLAHDGQVIKDYRTVRVDMEMAWAEAQALALLTEDR